MENLTKAGEKDPPTAKLQQHLHTTVAIPFSKSVDSYQPVSLYRGHFWIPSADKIRDTFFWLPAWKKGFCTINGFNLGRYWNIGPQQTLYVPAPLLRVGENEVILYEESLPAFSIFSIDKPILG